ncbi:TD and POZ domain-containing protein 3 [Araneus ventricosus]|uniref:TD and POZ domain-containing protein 3 n=1 Tax=Araneus ventricosus TaxID=182803 RepID=A0A4Y2CJB8_ARAVE|nr:TD and POZ domain-containing protein 3 [Araneus ventricosus]
MAHEENDEKCITIFWKIENITYISEKFDGNINSPSFVLDVMDETTWNLELYARGEEESRDYIGIYLKREEDASATANIELLCKLAVIGKDGSVQEADMFECSFLKGEGYGGLEFVRRQEIYGTKRSVFLPQDTLTVRCRIWKKGESILQDVRCFVRTRIGVEKSSFLWNLENFNTLALEKKISRVIKSPMNDVPLMSVDMFVTAGVNCDEIIRFVLSLQDKTIKYSTFRLSLVDVSGNKVECNQEEFWFDEQCESKKFTFCLTRKKLLANKKLLLPNDVLTLHWECAFSKGIVLEEIEEVQYGCTSSEVKISDTHKVNNDKILPSNSLTDNVKFLYDEKFLCDVNLKTITGTFPAHKAILSASSSVFKTMFSNDTKENYSDCVDINELDDDAVSGMLHYIYTSSVDDLTWESATDLYEAASKYAILSLKNICSSYMKNNLSRSNACEALLVADNHADGELKAYVLDYIVKHGKELINSEWRLLMNSNGKLAAEALYRLFYEN